MAEENHTMEEPEITTEEFKVSGAELVDKVKGLLHEGNIRRIVIKKDDEPVLILPLTVAAVSVVVAPTLAAVGAFAALVSSCTILVERVVEE